MPWRWNFAPAAAPPAVSLPSFSFGDGAKEVSTIGGGDGGNGMYRALIEHSVRSSWNRPQDMSDENYKADVEFSIDSKGRVTGSRWLSGSGDERWDNSVKAAVAQFKSLNKAPPKGFPNTFIVRFDVESTQTEGLQLSSH